MLITELVTKNDLGCVGMSSACTWLMRRSVRKPFVVEMISPMSSSVERPLHNAFYPAFSREVDRHGNGFC